MPTAETDNIARIAALSFAEHVIQDAPSRSWRMGEIGTSAYAFRITWAPGLLAVSGDIGSAVYEVWPAFQTLEGAVSLVAEANLDYLAGKSGVAKEFDRDATVGHLIRYAYHSLRNGHRAGLFKQLCEEYGGDSDDAYDRKEAVRSFRDDADLTAERVMNITGDFEDPRYSLPSSARWTFEAVKLWAKTVGASKLEDAA
jgi:hypothetical protein